MMTMLCNRRMHAQLPCTKSGGGGLPPAPHASLALFCFTDNGAVGLTVLTRARPIDALFWE